MYTWMYVHLHVLLLAGVMNKFRQSCLEDYKLDPSHVYTLPTCSWNVRLEMTDVNIELLRDIDMYDTASQNIERR